MYIYYSVYVYNTYTQFSLPLFIQTALQTSNRTCMFYFLYLCFSLLSEPCTRNWRVSFNYKWGKIRTLTIFNVNKRKFICSSTSGFFPVLLKSELYVFSQALRAACLAVYRA